MRKIKWTQIMDQWMIENGKEPVSKEQLMLNEGLHGPKFFNSIEDLAEYPHCKAAQWFSSGQMDFDFYKSYEYIYSLHFGWRILSGYVYPVIAKREMGNEVVDVGGSIFTAFDLVRRGVKKVIITNFDDSPQVEFAKYVIRLEDLPIVIAKYDDIPINSTLVCSEYLEHFKDVTEEIDRLLTFTPAKIYESSSFCMVAYGHYIPITVYGKEFTHGGSVTRALRLYLEGKSYIRERVPCYNHHFSVYLRKA